MTLSPVPAVKFLSLAESQIYNNIDQVPIVIINHKKHKETGKLRTNLTQELNLSIRED